jgi:hypothetical protein
VRRPNNLSGVAGSGGHSGEVVGAREGGLTAGGPPARRSGPGGDGLGALARWAEWHLASAQPEQAAELLCLVARHPRTRGVNRDAARRSPGNPGSGATQTPDDQTPDDPEATLAALVQVLTGDGLQPP